MNFTLEPWNDSHIPYLAGFANNHNIAKWLRDVFPFPYTVEDAKAFVTSCQQQDDAYEQTRAIVVDGKAVGSIGIFQGSDVYVKNAEIGYWLAEEYWGKGIMPRAICQMLDHAFETMDIMRIYAQPFWENRASRRVLEKVGFTLEGIQRQSIFKNGEIYDSGIYAMLKEEWNKRKNENPLLNESMQFLLR